MKLDPQEQQLVDMTVEDLRSVVTPTGVPIDSAVAIVKRGLAIGGGNTPLYLAADKYAKAQVEFYNELQKHNVEVAV